MADPPGDANASLCDPAVKLESLDDAYRHAVCLCLAARESPLYDGVKEGSMSSLHTQESFGDSRTKFVFTKASSAADVLRKYPSRRHARLVFHGAHFGEVRMSDGSYRCPLAKYDKISFVTMTPCAIELDFEGAFMSRDKIKVRVSGDVELAVRDDETAILAVTLDFAKEFSRHFNRLKAVIGEYCSSLTAEQIVAGGGTQITTKLSDGKADTAFETRSGRITADVPTLSEKVANRVEKSVAVADEIQTIADDQGLALKRLEAQRILKAAEAAADSEREETERRRQLVRVAHELELHTKQIEKDALTEKARREQVQARVKIITRNKAAIGLIDPALLESIHRHEEEMARIQHNEDAVRVAQERFVQDFERVWNAVAKTNSGPPIIIT